MIQTIGGEAGNCGCFGDLIPMSPLQALIKNLVTIGLLMLTLTKLKEGLVDKKNLNPVLYVGLTVSLLMFMLIPQSKLMSQGNNASVTSGEIVCYFSPTCEHCQETGKVLTEMKSEYPEILPEIRILFMDEAGDGSLADIKAYFDLIGTEYPYQVLSIEEFIPVFWEKHNFPGVKYLYNGEEIIFFSGTKEQKFDYEVLFDKEKLLEEIKKEY